MIFKVVTLFLVAIAVLGMFGKFRIGIFDKMQKRLPKSVRCKACGTPIPANGACPCGKKG